MEEYKMNKSFGKGLLIGFCVVFLLGNTRYPNDPKPDPIIGTYQVSTTIYESPRNGKTYVVETVINTKTGKTKTRKRVYIGKYKVIK